MEVASNQGSRATTSKVADPANPDFLLDCFLFVFFPRTFLSIVNSSGEEVRLQVGIGLMIATLSGDQKQPGSHICDWCVLPVMSGSVRTCENNDMP